MKKLNILLAGALLSASTPSFAQGIPVYDNASVAQTILQLQEMAEDAQRQLKQIEAMTGARNAGDLSNSAFERQLKEYLPTTWEDTLDMINAGTLPNGALGTQGIFSDIYNEYEPIKGEDLYASNPNGSSAKALNRKTGTTIAAMAASEQVFNQTAQRNQIYQNLLTELNNSEDMKNSIDLQARIAAENGMALNQMMRQNAMEMQQRAATDNESLVDIKRAANANTYDAAKAKEAMTITP